MYATVNANKKMSLVVYMGALTTLGGLLSNFQFVSELMKLLK